MNNKQRLGSVGEDFAKTYLEACLGWDILTRNWRCKVGELDIVALDKECLVAVEVRTRQGTEPGSVIEAIGDRKLRQLYRVLRFFLPQIDPEWTYNTIRVDAIAMRFCGNEVQELIHIRNALVVDEICGF